MSPKQIVADVFEKLGGQVTHTAKTAVQEPVKMAKKLLGEPVSEEETGGGGQPVDPQTQQLKQQQYISQLRQLDERKKQEHLMAIRKQAMKLREWEEERKKREMEERQEAMVENKEEEEKKKKKVEIKQLERQEKAEVLSVKRAKIQVEARLGKF